MTTPTRPPQPITLNDRDHAIITNAATGHTRRETSLQLGVTERTIQSRLRTIGHRLNLPRAAQAAIVAEIHRLDLIRYPMQPRATVLMPDRQRQILRILPSGKTSTEIGLELHITENSVKTHLRNMFASINARTRAHAVALDLEHQFSAPLVQIGRLRAAFAGRVVFRGGHMIHAWNGVRSACRIDNLDVADKYPLSEPVTCKHCQTSLALPAPVAPVA